MKKKPINKNSLKQRFSPWAWLLLIVIALIYIALNYAGKEGLNPTDDGVILAQSWRIIQGEIPHADFISIRPAVSGFLHSIHFLLPFPVEISARYFVLFQFFIIAFSWLQFFRLKTNFKHEIPLIYKLSLLLIAWIISIFNYNLFPWTTIDAIFWVSLGFYLTQRSFHIRRFYISMSIGLMAFILAAMSHQPFIIVAIISWIWTIRNIIRQKILIKGLLAALTALIPAFLYLIMLISNNALPDFISQISRKTGIYEYAIKTYYDLFIISNLKWINIAIIVISIFIGAGKQIIKKLRAQLVSLPSLRIMFIIETGLVLYLIISIPHYFIASAERDVFTLPYDAFWILIDLLVISSLVQSNKFNSCIPAWIGLLIAWVSSISEGCNTPVFAFGILILSILYVYLIKYQDALLLKQQKWLKILLPVIALIFFLSGTYSQMNINYRDVGFKDQTHNLKNINSNYGNIKTNKFTYSYLNEIDSLINEYNNSKIAFVPDNSIIYPVYRLQNPLPLDWNQPQEYAGQEERYYSELKNTEKDVIICVQKINSKKMFDGFDKIKRQEYPNLQHISNNYRQVGETNYFRLYTK